MRQISCLSTTVIPALQLASVSEKDTSRVSRLVPGALRGESVAIEDGVILSFSSPTYEGDQVSSRCCHDNGRRRNDLDGTVFKPKGLVR